MIFYMTNSISQRLKVKGQSLKKICSFILLPFTIYLLPFLVGCTSSPIIVRETCSVEARIFPDYQGELLVPNNIAPMNFEILESGKCFAVQIATQDKTLWQTQISQSATSSQPLITIPQKEWQKILENHTGDTLQIRVFSGNSYNEMIAYKPFLWLVSEDRIDPFIVFRHIPVVGTQEPQSMGIYERSLETFEQRTLTEPKLVDGACMNCHHFSANQSSTMCVHFRRQHPGTLITTPDSAFMVNISLPNGEKGVFGAFSPNERFLAFSTNQLTCIHDMRVKRLKTWSYDTEANIFVYDILHNTILSSDELTAESFQKTYPAWSHDGKYLYFCQSNQQPQLIKDTSALFDRIQNTHYTLVRTELNTDQSSVSTLLTPETIVDQQMIFGKSISFPTCSPDGRFIAFSTTEFGTLDPLSTDGRLWLYNLNSQTAQEFEPDMENPIVSSSAWSSNSRWLVVSSRRMDGIYVRPFLIHVDSLGNTSKPFVMPQKDPDIYRKQDYSYSLPELINAPVPMSAYDIANAVRKPVKQPNYLYHFEHLKPIVESTGKHTE